jgi:hypothetical protein
MVFSTMCTRLRISVALLLRLHPFMLLELCKRSQSKRQSKRQLESHVISHKRLDIRLLEPALQELIRNDVDASRLNSLEEISSAFLLNSHRTAGQLHSI